MKKFERKDSILLIIYCRLFGGSCMHIFLFVFITCWICYFIFLWYFSVSSSRCLDRAFEILYLPELREVFFPSTLLVKKLGQ